MKITTTNNYVIQTFHLKRKRKILQGVLGNVSKYYFWQTKKQLLFIYPLHLILAINKFIRILCILKSVVNCELRSLIQNWSHLCSFYMLVIFYGLQNLRFIILRDIIFIYFRVPLVTPYIWQQLTYIHLEPITVLRVFCLQTNASVSQCVRCVKKIPYANVQTQYVLKFY